MSWGFEIKLPSKQSNAWINEGKIFIIFLEFQKEEKAITTYTQRIKRENIEKYNKMLQEQSDQRKIYIQNKLSEINEKVGKIETEYNTIQINRDKIDMREYSIIFIFMFRSIEMFSNQVDCAEEILNEINNQDLDQFRDLEDYAKGPWMTLKEFEESLKKSAQSHIIKYTNMVNFYERKLSYIQNQTAFRDEALELAMLYTKLTWNEQVEQSQMEKEDIDSQFLRFMTEGVLFKTDII